MVRKLTIVSHASAPSDRSDKLLAANEVIDENHPASDLSTAKMRRPSSGPKKIQKFVDGFFLENPSYLLGDLERSPIFRKA